MNVVGHAPSRCNIILVFTLSLAPHTFSPALPGDHTALTILFCGPLAHAQSRPAAGARTTIVKVALHVQVPNAVQADEAWALEDEAFLARMMAACLRGAFQIFAPEL